MFNIYTNTVQNDIGPNKNVTDKKRLFAVYEDTEPYPIGVKAEDLTIVCTDKGLLTWLSNEENAQWSKIYTAQRST